MHRLNPHLIKLGIPSWPPVAETVAPDRLATPDRFGIAFKHIYAQHYLLGGRSEFPAQLYAEHIRAITGGTCREDDGSKASLEDYFASFIRVLESMRAHGFDHANSVIPVDRNYVALDGTHRIAAALALNLPVPVLKFSHEGPRYTNAVFKEVPEAMRDRAAVELCKLCADLRLMIVFAGAGTRVLHEHVSVDYMAPIRLDTPTAQANMIRELYLGEAWLGDSANGYPGAAPKARECFKSGSPYATVYLVRGDVVAAKKAIRAQDGGKHDLVHATDTQTETVRVARCLLHPPSVAFLARPHKHLPRFEGLLDEYRAVIGETDQDLLCVDGSATMAAYGLREPEDLDFVHAVNVPNIRHNVSSHNSYADQYPLLRDELIWNPVYYFWSRGVKFASLDAVRRVKTHIVDSKNGADLKLMEGFHLYIVIDSLQMEICVQLKQGTIISDNSPFMLFKSTRR